MANTQQRKIGAHWRHQSHSCTHPVSTSHPRTNSHSARVQTTSRQRNVDSIRYFESERTICAISESRGVSPAVGLAFVNLDTCETTICQLSDTQTYTRTIHKLHVYGPLEILIVSTSAHPPSKLYCILQDQVIGLGSKVTLLDRLYWAEDAGLDYIQRLAFNEDVEAIKIAITGNYFAICCVAAVLSYIELAFSKTFPLHSLRVKYEPPEGSMMIDFASICSLELVQNLHNPKSKNCLFGLLNSTLTPMGSRLLRSNILQPSTDKNKLEKRLDALDELTSKESVFSASRKALSSFLDLDKILSKFTIILEHDSLAYIEQLINNIIMLKKTIAALKEVHDSLIGTQSSLLIEIRQHLLPDDISPIQELIDSVLNEEAIFANQPLELRNQRIYAVKSGINDLLDVARQTYKEVMMDAYELVQRLSEEHQIPLDLKFEAGRQFFIRFAASELDDRQMPFALINIFRKKTTFECQTIELLKINQKAIDSHQEVLKLSYDVIKELVIGLRTFLPKLFKVSEALAILDMLLAFGCLVTTNDYGYIVRPQITDTLAIKSGRHPIRDSFQANTVVPNDVYATQHTRFQIITGCNMSGKSTYIRSIALMTVMVQIGCFVPAQYASFPILHQLFARVSTDDNIEANVSTFATEMLEAAFILRNINPQSMVIIDELGRGTSTRDGLAIALAIAESLLDSKAIVWFVTHFRDLSRIMHGRNGVINLHMAVNIAECSTMTMLYRIAEGTAKEIHYGLCLASVSPLPQSLIGLAKDVAKKLDRQKYIPETQAALLYQKRRKLVLGLKENLTQAINVGMSGNNLMIWLQELQANFVIRMTSIEAHLVGRDETH